MGHGESYTCDSCGYTVHFQMGGGGLLIDYEPFVMEGKSGIMRGSSSKRTRPAEWSPHGTHMSADAECTGQLNP